MMIEIRRAQFVNKGAELMLHAILRKVSGEIPAAKFVMAPDLLFAPYNKRAVLGLYQKSWYQRYGVQWGHLGSLLPKKLRIMYGIVLDSEINVVLDAAGFSYSDQWGPASTIALAKAIMRWKRRGTKVVLLPQAFGPFTSSVIRDAIKVVADQADLIFARERESYAHLVSVVGERPNIKIAPDFTNLLEGVAPEGFDKQKNRFCIVPNCRMIDKTSSEESTAYVPFLITCTKSLLERGAKPFILVHEGEDDFMLARRITDALDARIEIVRETDPLKIKGILGACDGSIGSRFHGLVSALSQAVPSLATGWSHKYKMLFEDYGFPDGLIAANASQAEIDKALSTIVDEGKRPILIERLRTAGTRQKELANGMWQDVFSVLA
jgi:colanic acid/amylovoran biosynthesis protein